MAVNVFTTNSTGDNLSRHDLINWVNGFIDIKFRKIEDLCTGAAYCLLTAILFPTSVPIKRVKVSTNLEHEYVQNFKIVQAAFKKNSVNKIIPVEKLIKGKFQANLEFLQWFKRFFEANYNSKEQDAVSVKDESILEAIEDIDELDSPEDSPKMAATKRPISSKLSPKINEEVPNLHELFMKYTTVAEETNFYSAKLHEIKKVYEEADKNAKNRDVKPKIFDILYAPKPVSPFQWF